MSGFSGEVIEGLLFGAIEEKGAQTKLLGLVFVTEVVGLSIFRQFTSNIQKPSSTGSDHLDDIDDRLCLSIIFEDGEGYSLYIFDSKAPRNSEFRFIWKLLDTRQGINSFLQSGGDQPLIGFFAPNESGQLAQIPGTCLVRKQRLLGSERSKLECDSTEAWIDEQLMPEASRISAETLQ